MNRLNETNSLKKKVTLLLLCFTLLLGSFSSFVFAEETASTAPEFIIGNSREEVVLNGEWDWTIFESEDNILPEIIPENFTYDNKVFLPSYTELSDDIKSKELCYVFYNKTFSLANRPGESVIFDYGVSSGAYAVYVNNMKCDTQDISVFLKTGVNNVTVVKEYRQELNDKYHFTDSLKLVFSNTPVITNVNIKTDVKSGTVAVDVALYNSRELAVKTDVSVQLTDGENNVVGSYLVEDVDILEGSNTSANVTGIAIKDFSEKNLWSAAKPNVYYVVVTVSGDSVTIPFGFIPENLFGSEGYEYGMDIVVSDFFANPKNTGYTWSRDWVAAYFDYIKEFNWNVITYRDGYLPKVWSEVALEKGILLVDKNNDEQWKTSQEVLWKKDSDFLAVCKEQMDVSKDVCLYPVVYKGIDGLFAKSPSFTDISKIRLQNLFKTTNVIEPGVHEEKDEGFLGGIISYFKEMINKTFIKDNRYQLFLTGLGNTLLVAAAATVFGVFIGIFVAVIKVAHAQNKYSKKKNPVLSVLNFIAEVYTAIIRGTPVVVQLLITYNVIFVFSDEAVMIGIFAFSINSGAYISEIIRAGINSVDRGQTEAGRSLGLSQFTTMKSIVLPQALKNILPALGNEFIALLKETSVIGYLGVVDLTRAGELVRSRTADAFFTLIFVAIIYFILVFGLSSLIKYFERRLNKSDKH